MSLLVHGLEYLRSVPLYAGVGGTTTHDIPEYAPQALLVLPVSPLRPPIMLRLNVRLLLIGYALMSLQLEVLIILSLQYQLYTLLLH